MKTEAFAGQGRIADAAAIQFRMLNASKGPAVRGPRCQVDRGLYKQAMQEALRRVRGLQILDGAVRDVLLKGDGRGGCPCIAGVVLSTGGLFSISCGRECSLKNPGVRTLVWGGVGGSPESQVAGI